MKRPQDSDIFGTKADRVAPRITNNHIVNPNATFQKRTDAQYQSYSQSLHPRTRNSLTETQQSFTKVNQEADFDEYYHHNRKECDMQSTIFYQPTMGNSRMTERSRITQRQVPRHAYNMADQQPSSSFGRKETLNREVINLPENTTEFKGNSSNIFDYNEKVERNMVKNKVDKLIPHQMQWDQHDSVKYQDNKNQANITQLEQSQSTVFDQETLEKHIRQLKIENNDENNSLDDNKQPTVKKVKAEDAKTVEIVVLKGWNPNLVEGLSKYCRINGTKIVSFNFEGTGKGTLVLERSKRWETITDWLRKDAKLRIRVKN